MARESIDTALAPRALPRALPRVAVLALACALAALTGCPSRTHDLADAHALQRLDTPLAWSVHRAQATRHLATSSLESQDAAPGYQYVVLDVSVRNRDRQPQVLSEGKLIAVDEANLQTFDQPVTLLSDDYLSLQVLAPNQGLRGKIAYEVPEHLPGVLYWSPGNGSQRILLNVNAPLPPTTLADAGEDVAPATDIDANAATVDAANAVAPRAAVDGRARVSAPEHSAAHSENAVAATAAPSARATQSPVPAAVPVRAPTRVAALAPAPIRPVAVAAAPTALPAVAPPRAIVDAHADARTDARDDGADREQARQLACAGLAERDDPAEKARSLGFFSQSCRDYTLPPHWRPEPARRSLLARASSLLGRLVVRPHVVRLSDCSTASSQADTLVCADPRLSAMDHQLAQSVERARDEVADPDALQREQEQWRQRVRNSCASTGCLAQAYGRRIAQLDALASARD